MAWAVATRAGARVAGAGATGVVRTSQNQAASRKRHFGTAHVPAATRNTQPNCETCGRRPRTRFARMPAKRRLFVISLDEDVRFA